MHHGPGTAQEHNCADGRSAVARLNRRKPVLTQEQLARLVAVAPLPGTWHRKPTAPQERRRSSTWLRRFRTEVVGARRRRVVWALAVAACFVVAVLKLPVTVAWVLPMLMHR
jgi:hypothetical protein